MAPIEVEDNKGGTGFNACCMGLQNLEVLPAQPGPVSCKGQTMRFS